MIGLALAALAINCLLGGFVCMEYGLFSKKYGLFLLWTFVLGYGIGMVI